MFSNLPLVAKSDSIFMCHGGIPTDPDFDIDQINGFERKYTIDNATLIELLWNDPIFENTDKINEVKLPSRRGPGIWNFGIPVTKRFFKKNKLELLMRAHTALFDGSMWMQDKRILSLFTAQSGVYKPFKRHVAKLDLNNINTIEIIDISDDTSM